MGQKQENQEYLYSWGKLGWKMVKVHLPSFLGHRFNTSCPQDPSFRMMWLSRFSLVCVQTGLSQNSLPPHALRRSWLIWISCVANQWLFGSYIIIFWILCLTWSSFLVLCSCLNHLRTVAPSQDAILSYSWWESIYGGVDFFNEFQSYRQFGSIFFLIKCSTLIQLSNILWTSLGMELPREIDTKVLKLGFYMFLYGLHWDNLGGGHPSSLTTCHMFLRQLEVVDPKIHDWNMLEYETNATNSVVLNLATSFWTRFPFWCVCLLRMEPEIPDAPNYGQILREEDA